jgi:enoyl-CoA hydratase/carnithine racemase
MAEELIRRHEGRVTHLTLNRPQKANALSASLVEALLDAVEYAATDGTRLLVLEGAGAHFCAGFDFTGYLEASEGELALRFIRIETLLQQLHHAPFATLVTAHGSAFGAGADLVCACAVRVAAPGASFCMPGLKFGVVLGTRRLALRVGADRARELLSTARVFDAQEALAIGFLTHVAPAAEWPALVAAHGAACAQLAPGALANLNRQSLPDTRDADLAALARSVCAPGLKERMRLFREAAR